MLKLLGVSAGPVALGLLGLAMIGLVSRFANR
jgi:hypothetical protein